MSGYHYNVHIPVCQSSSRHIHDHSVELSECERYHKSIAKETVEKEWRINTEVKENAARMTAIYLTSAVDLILL